MNPLLIVPVVVLLLASCTEVKKSEDVKSDEISQRYRCTYRPDGSGTLTADFLLNATWDRLAEEKHSDSYVDFGEKSPVTCNGMDMKREEGSLSGVYYTCSFPAGTREITIVWTDKDGKKYTHKAPLYPFELISDEDKKDWMGDNWKVKWKGEPSNSNSRVKVTLKGRDNTVTNDKKDKYIYESEFAEKDGDNFVLFTAQRLRNMKGSLEVTAKRTTCIRLTEVTKGEGSLKVEGDGGEYNTSSGGILF
ncbi:MAG TPA: hypothetical protein VD905_19380 [Flavobacteriales bacterium]|nr:hypothetical protein [Flavobacteriales bacterium]